MLDSDYEQQVGTFAKTLLGNAMCGGSPAISNKRRKLDTDAVGKTIAGSSLSYGGNIDSQEVSDLIDMQPVFPALNQVDRSGDEELGVDDFLEDDEEEGEEEILESNMFTPQQQKSPIQDDFGGIELLEEVYNDKMIS